MKTSTIIWIIVVVVILAGGIYWIATANSSTNTQATQEGTTTVPATVPTLTVASTSAFPSYLAASNGMALYTFKSDTSGVSTCTGGCAAAWPPYTVSSASGLAVGTGVTGTLGTITRSDGTIQVTYNGMPLYFFAKDTAPGQVTGNNNDNFFVALPNPATTTQPQAAAKTTTTVTTHTTTPAPTAPAYNY